MYRQINITLFPSFSELLTLLLLATWTLAFPRKGGLSGRGRLARCLGIAWDAVRFLNRDWAEVRSGPG